MEEREREEARRRRAQEEENRRREALRKVAPGFEPSQTLVPKKVGVAASVSAKPLPDAVLSEGGSGGGSSNGRGSTGTRDMFPLPPKPVVQKDVMADLVDQLAALDAAHSAESGRNHPSASSS